MTAVAAYAGYLRTRTGRQPQTVTRDGSTILISRHGPGRRLTVSFRYVAVEDSQVAGVG